MDLKTDYLGLVLPHPFVAGASTGSDTEARCVQLEQGGASAIVLRSLFEEQIDRDALAHHQAEVGHADAHSEARSYLPMGDDCVFGPDEYLEHLRQVKRAVTVPVLASLNGITWAWPRLRALRYTFGFTPSVRSSTFLPARPSFANSSSRTVVTPSQHSVSKRCMLKLLSC
jgi:dihydroorotate dehydrogenase (fumarate)